MRVVVLFLLSALLVGCGLSQQKDGYKLVWSDEFDYQGLPDSSRWNYDTVNNAIGWGNNEAQWYTSENINNALVSDGTLKITAIQEEVEGRAFSSARLTTKHKGDWLYGKIEVRAKLPNARGIWPAIWMLPTDWVYGGWPKSGEIDILEYVGYEPDSIYASVHTGRYNHAINTQKTTPYHLPDTHLNFHVYSLEWDSLQCQVWVDDQKCFTFNNEKTDSDAWPFDQSFHLILNVAVGGNWGGKFGIDTTAFPQTMEIDYVRVYQKQ